MYKTLAAAACALATMVNVAYAAPLSRQSHQPPVERRMNVVVDATARTTDVLRANVHGRGQIPAVQAFPAENVTPVQLTAYGLKKVPSTASGILVRTRNADQYGTSWHYYVYNPRTHYIVYEAEVIELPASARKAANKR
jgi:hypothetical protein